MHINALPLDSRRHIRPLRGGITGGCEPPAVVLGTKLLFQSRCAVSHPSSLRSGSLIRTPIAMIPFSERFISFKLLTCEVMGLSSFIRVSLCFVLISSPSQNVINMLLHQILNAPVHVGSSSNAARPPDKSRLWCCYAATIQFRRPINFHQLTLTRTRSKSGAGM